MKWVTVVFVLEIFIILTYGFENLAVNKNAAQSSVYKGGATGDTQPVWAVDGVVNQAWPQLAVTNFDVSVWWYVDLGAPRNIHNITVYHRKGSTPEFTQTRFAGFSVYISNTNFTTRGGYNCGVNSTAPPEDYPIVCLHAGRYVTYYNYRSDGYAIVELREIEVYGPDLQEQLCKKANRKSGCPNATVYGADCDMPCSDKCRNTWCNIINGTCFSCNDGFHGIECDIPCSAGKHGENCMYNCSMNCVDPMSCNHVNGSCIGGCQPGWKDDKCIQSCDDGKYGQDCLQDCGNCLGNATCDNVNGSCASCDPGYLMPLCKSPCSAGKYGEECKYSCSSHCVDPLSCDHISGSCTCKPGWKGNICNQTCDPGEYGPGCVHTCGSCKNGTVCNAESGHCESGCDIRFTGILCKDCEAGYIGGNCNQACADGKYGQNCLLTCGYCLGGEVCNKQNGHCKDCLKEYKPPLCSSSSQDFPLDAGIGIGNSVVIFLAILSTVGYVIVRKCRTISNIPEPMKPKGIKHVKDTTTVPAANTKDTNNIFYNVEPDHMTYTDASDDYHELSDVSNNHRPVVDKPPENVKVANCLH